MTTVKARLVSLKDCWVQWETWFPPSDSDPLHAGMDEHPFLLEAKQL